MKIYLRGTLPKGRRADHNRGVEVYDSGSFFCVTGWHLEGAPREVCDCPQLADLYYWIFGEPDTPRTRAGCNGDDREMALDALAGLSATRADGYHTWLGTGMALHSVDQSQGMLDAWDVWSRKCPEKYIAGVCAQKWASFKKSGLGIGSLLRWARADGWATPSGRNGPTTRGTREQKASRPRELAERVLSNAEYCGEGEDAAIVPLPMAEVIEMIKVKTDNWPRRVSESLFVHESGSRVCWLTQPSALFGWLSGKYGIVRWHRNLGCVSKEEVFQEVKRTAAGYDSVELLPHWPPIPNRYYACEFPTPGDGQTVDKFLDFFSPETDSDRQLFLAALLTPLWGGPPGARPAFMWTSRGGRGKGKSKAAMHIARVYGGHVDVSPNEEIGSIKTRFLTPEAATLRVALLDNVKTTRFSWAELEGLITSDIISGKKLYVGNANRPNDVTWFITLNGASLSTDMAQRVVEIRLKDPTFDGGWEERVLAFIQTQGTAVIADLIGILQRAPQTLPEHSRWATWESQVLVRLYRPAELLKLILERRDEIDVEGEEGQNIEAFFASKLRWLGYEIERDDVFIPNEITARWYNQATGDNRKTTGVSRTLKQLFDEHRIHRLVQARGGQVGDRGFRWIGEHADASEPTKYDIRRRLAAKTGKSTGEEATTRERGGF